jgi:hypothetical protein
MVRRAADRPTAIGARGKLGEVDSERNAQRALEIHADGSGRCVADLRDASALHMTVSSDVPYREVAHSGFRWGHRPFGGAPGRDGQCADRSQVAVALSAVTD